MGLVLRNKVINLLLLLIAVMPLLDVIYPAKLEGVSRTVPIIFKIILVTLLIKYFIENQKKWWFKNIIGKILTVFVIVHLLYLLVSSIDLAKDLYKLSKTIIWYCGFFFFMNLGYHNYLSQKNINRYFTVVIALIFVLVFFGVTNEALFKSNRDYGASNFAYYLLFAMPFMFTAKKVPYRLIIFILISIGVAISFKRGTMLLYGIMVVYLLFFSNLKGVAGKRFSKFFRIFIVVTILLVLYQVVFSNFDNYIDKFSDVTEANENNYESIGSGRGTLYYLPIERWLNSNPFHFLFGYGFNSTPRFYPTTGIFKKGFYAHSDFVMLIHDYGVVGLSILISLFMRLIKVIKNSELMVHKVPLTLIFLALLIKAIFSGFIIYEYSVYGFAILGLILGKTRRTNLEYKINENR